MNRKKLFVVLLIFLLPLFVVLSIYLFDVYFKSKPPGLTADEKIELLKEKNNALGQLENANFEKAIPSLEKIVAAAPEEPLGHRNLAIALFKPATLTVESALAASETEQLARLLVVVEQMLKLEADQAAAQFLAGRVYAKQAELLRGVEAARMDEAVAKAKRCFAEAGRLAPDDVGPLYDLYLLEKQYGDPEDIPPEGVKALQAVRSRSPENLACLLELLKVLMQKKSPEARVVVEQILRVIPGDADTLIPNVHPRRTLAEVAAILEKSSADPPAGAFELRNELESQLDKFFGFYQRDKARLRPHPLSFVLEDFRSQFYAGLPTDAEPPLAVTFTEIPRGQAKPKLIAQFRDDLPQSNAWATVHLSVDQGKTLVEVQDEDAKAAMPTFELQGRFRHMQLADLDLDIQAAGGDAKDNIPADLDLILYGDEGLRVLEQRAEGEKRRWLDRTDDCKFTPLVGIRWLLNADIDHDGNLDLVVGLAQGVKVLRNRGAWAFEDITKRSTGLDSLTTLDAAYGDFDRDGDLDVLLVHGDGTISLLDNRRGGRFEVVAVNVRIEFATCLAVLDFNNDGRLDCLVGYRQGAAILRGNAKGMLEPDVDRLALPATATTDVLPFDYDNDGWMDALLIGTAGSETTLRLFRNVQGKHFEVKPDLLPGSLPEAKSFQFTDLPAADGDLDVLFIGKGGQPMTFSNEGGNANRWLNLRLRAELNRDASGEGQATKSNYRCIGGTAEVRAGRHYQMQVVTGTETHFGLGNRRQVETVRSIWPNGVPQAALRPATNALLVENQRPKGSCPYLFTWDGERFVLITDCLWSSALGMKLAHGVEMPFDRQHNYLVIPGDKLKPKNGRYEVRFTNELWEAPYLDQAELWVVDHPADVEVFTNARIPPDAKEPFRLHTAKQKRVPKAARDHRGRDVLDVIAHRDGHYLGGFRRQRYVGLAEPHYLELDLGDFSLGDLGKAKQVMLFLTGWIWPTDTSGNVAISQDPRFAGPTGVVGGAQPPALLVADGKGGWTTLLPMMGFMSGKMQTVAVPLAVEQFPSKDYRVRIATSMEIYWDEVMFTVDESLAEHTLKKLSAAAAELRYRGYSRIQQVSPTSPFVHDYHDVDPRPAWLPVPGRCTRHGPVAELLTAADSQYVVMSPGDELALSFNELPLPRPGWARTFIFYGNGWLKDFDMNGSAGEAIGPYPFDGMKRYPYAAPESHPYPQFLRDYLNREDDLDRFWNRLGASK